MNFDNWITMPAHCLNVIKRYMFLDIEQPYVFGTLDGCIYIPFPQ